MSLPSESKKRKRQRPIISCNECHRRKQKCDRNQPCGNCTMRAASHLCEYSGTVKPPTAAAPEGESASPAGSAEVGGSYGYVHGRGFSAVDVLEKLDLGGGTWGKCGVLDVSEQAELQSYNRIIATIPPRPYTSLLVKVFFDECNWIYWCVHNGTFYQMLDEWYESCASSNPPCPAHGRSGNLEKQRVLSQFPALLLQVLGVALRMLPREHWKQVAQLTLGKEDFKPLSTAYSNAACELATLLSSNQATLPRIQQWFLRASWLKSEGRPIESWHALGQAIREAQELGLHKESPRNFNGGLEALWHREIEKRVWVNLYIWDRFMGMVLGRPTLINDRHCTVTTPLDCDIPTNLTSSPIVRRPFDPPSQFSQRLMEYQLSSIINEIDDLQFDSSLDSSSVERLHAKVRSYIEVYPPAFAVVNRDTSHDQTAPFIRPQAELLRCSTFSLIAGLHRPFVFTRQHSRTEIVKAGIAVLESQKQLFEVTREHHHTLYTFNFFTFDPAVLIAAAIITSPLSLSKDSLDTAMFYLRDGVRRMELLGRRIPLAGKGAAVLKLLVKKAESSRVASQHRRTPESSDNSSPATVACSPAFSSVPNPVDESSSGELLGFSGSGPINTGILSSRELGEILTAPDPIPGTDGLSTMSPPFEAGIIDDSDNFWQSLLYVPFQ